MHNQIRVSQHMLLGTNQISTNFNVHILIKCTNPKAPKQIRVSLDRVTDQLVWLVSATPKLISIAFIQGNNLFTLSKSSIMQLDIKTALFQ